jgi:HK97 family phage major capsid protein
VVTTVIEAQRKAVTTGLRTRMLIAAGHDPRRAGRAYNQATPAPPKNAIDPERMVIPTSQAELEAMLGDSAKMQKVFAGQNGEFGEFVTNYARAVHNRDLSIATQVKEQTESILANWLRENQPEGVERIDLTPQQVVKTGNARNHLHNPKAMGAVLDREFKNSAEFFQTIWHNANRTADMQAKLSRVRNAFSSTVPSEGGFLIPEVLRSEMLAVALESSVVRQRARVIPMETLRVPFPAIDATSNVSSVYGGVVGYWTEEGAALTASQAAFSRIVLDAKKLTAYTEVPNELISDSAVSFQAFLDQIFPEALSFYEDIAFLKGTGVGEPLGALAPGNGAIISVAKESGQVADTIYWENIVKMYSRMLPSSLDRAVWVCSIDVFPQLATMALSVGTGGSAIWLNNGVQGPPMTILGRPVIFTEKAPGLLGDLGDISFVDFGFYLIGDRQVMFWQIGESDGKPAAPEG